MINGEHEFAEVFFDDVVVPADRMLGELHGGWAVAMSILPYERSSCFWQRIAYLYRRLERLVDAVPARRPQPPRSSGNAFIAAAPLRARSRATQHRLAAGATLGAETSIDKVLVATAEQTTYDAVRRAAARRRRARRQRRPAETGAREYLYSRAATIYGGTAEVQRNIIARRLLDLGRRLMDAAERALLAATVRRRARPTPREHARRRRRRARAARLARHAGGRAARRGRRSCSRALGRPTRPRPCSTTCSRRRSASRREPDLAVLLPAVRRVEAARTIDGDRSRREGLTTARAATATRARRGRVRRRHGSTIVPPAAADVTPVRGIDPDAGLHAVARGRARRRRARSTRAVWATRVAVGARAARGRAPDRAARAHDARPRAHAHALERVQFGRPIAAFQAVRHRLADALVAVEALEAALAAADDEPDPRPPRSRRRSPGGRHAPSPPTASRCSPASASPPTTRSTAS